MRGPMSFNSLKFSIYSFFFVILLASPLNYDFSKNIYLKNLCTNLNTGLPTTQDTCVLLLIKITNRYVDSELAKKVENPPNDLIHWEILFEEVKSKYSELEPLLKAIRLKKIPANKIEWIRVINFIETSMKDCFDLETRKQVQLIMKSNENSTCDYKKAFADLAELYPFPSKPNDLNEAIKKCEDLVRKCEILDNELTGEKQLRLYYQALIDFHELITGLVEECYPEWARHRNQDDFSDDVWRAIFLNIEHTRILTIKLELKNSGVTEKQFVQVANAFLKKRRVDADKVLSSYSMLLSNSERERAYPQLLRTTDETERAVIKAILQYSYTVEGCKVSAHAFPKASTSEPLPTTINPRYLPSAVSIIEETKKLRRKNKLMEITYPLPGMLNADDILKELLQGDDELKLKSELQEDNILAIYVPNKETIYILFDDFESAYKALKYFKNKEMYYYVRRSKSKYLIRTAHDFKLNNEKYCNIKIEPVSDVNNDKLRQNVKDCLSSTNVRPMVTYQPYIKSKIIHQEWFLQFTTSEEMLVAYGKIRKSCNSLKATIISENPKIQSSTVTINPDSKQLLGT